MSETEVVRRNVIAKFEATFQKGAQCIVRCPGRVNLIGEHIDYNGYPVLPMATEQSVFAAVCVDADALDVVVDNLDDEFPRFQCALDDFDIVDLEPTWRDYFLCGVRAALDLYNKSEPSESRLKGFSALVGGSIPIAAGLSSSSALVCCAALCTLYALFGNEWEKMVSREKVAEECALAERYVGTQGGGMDQAICMLAEKSTAMLIEFNPLRLNRVGMPHSMSFLVCNSMVESKKGSSVSLFNVRVAECRLAAMIMARQLNLPQNSICTLQDVQQMARKELREMGSLVSSILHKQPYDTNEIVHLLQSSVDNNRLSSYLISPDGKYHLYDRAMHVYEESLRVHEFRKICDDSFRRRSVSSQDLYNTKIGELLNASHKSCSLLYDCSCKQVDDLQRMLTTQFMGTVFGARMTGAGWGGCLVANIEANNATTTLELVRISSARIAKDNNEPSPRFFLCSPSAGATVQQLRQ